MKKKKKRKKRGRGREGRERERDGRTDGERYVSPPNLPSLQQ